MKNHLKYLKEKHAELNKKIKDGYTHYLDDEHLVRSNTKNHWLKNNHFNRKTIK